MAGGTAGALRTQSPGYSFGHCSPPCCCSSLDLAARTHPTSLKGSGLLHPPFQKSWALSVLLLLPAAHYTSPEVGLHINSTYIVLVASHHLPPAARDRHTQGDQGPEEWGHPAAQKQGQRLH